MYRKRLICVRLLLRFGFELAKCMPRVRPAVMRKVAPRLASQHSAMLSDRPGIIGQVLNNHATAAPIKVSFSEFLKSSTHPLEGGEFSCIPCMGKLDTSVVLVQVSSLSNQQSAGDPL